MAGLQLKVTPAGRAAIVNLPNTGTNAVTITQIGVTATAFDPETLPGTLPKELKRVTAIGGAAVADDTIHITLSDDSADTYSLRGFALYLADGTLFALYGQTEVILEKSAQATLLLSADVKFADIDATAIEFGDANFTNPPATTDVFGVTRYATNAEANTGTADNRSITARALKFVLDSRFGVGAPSAFMKGLLALATAALVRAALEIKGAALHDTGSGNGLDADLLDGQHGAYYRQWSSLTGVPSTFAPSAHSHAAGDITSGVFANARISQSSVTQHQAALSIAWSQLSGVTAYASRWPAWGEVTDKPSTFPPSAHGHAIGDVSGLQAALNARGVLSGGNEWSGAQRFSGGHIYIDGSNLGVVMQTGGEEDARLRATPTAVVLSHAKGGQVLLRPNGDASSSGQVSLTTGGLLSATAFDSASGSDRRLKTDLRPNPRGLAEVLDIETKVGRYLPIYTEDDRERLFVIAQQLAPLVPEAVQDGAIEIDGERYATVDYLGLVPVLIRAVQELHARLVEVESR